MKWKGAGGSEPDHSVEETTETEMMKEVKVDGITITGMSKNQARNAILIRRGKECRPVRLLDSNGSASEFRRGFREAMFSLIR